MNIQLKSSPDFSPKPSGQDVISNQFVEGDDRFIVSREVLNATGLLDSPEVITVTRISAGVVRKVASILILEGQKSKMLEGDLKDFLVMIESARNAYASMFN